MHIISDDTLRNSEASPSLPPTLEPPTDIAELLAWLNTEIQRDLEMVREAVLAYQAAVARLDEVFTRRIGFWQATVDDAPHRRVSPRSRTVAPTGVVAALAGARRELLKNFRADLPDLEVEIDFGRLSEID
jgi:hypothetical protein